MGQKRVHKKDHDHHNEKESRALKREQNTPSGETLEHRSGHSIEEGGQNEQRGEPVRPGFLTPKGPRPLKND